MLAYATGLVHPVHGGWYIERPLEFQFPDSVWKLTVVDSRFHLQIQGSEPADIPTFRNHVASIVQGCLDALGFHIATPLRVEVLSLVIDGTRLVHFVAGWPELLEEPKAAVSGEKLGPFVYAVLGEPLARLALADLSSAIDSPDDTPFLAYRAIESVRQWFLKDAEEDEGKARAASWVEMRTQLAVDEADGRRLAQLAAQRRHGAAKWPTAEEREESLRLSRAIVARFVDFLERRRVARVQAAAQNETGGG